MLYPKTEAKLTLRPDLDYTKVTACGKPSSVRLGAFTGFSLPVYAADEELFMSLKVPERWNGITDMKFKVCVYLAGPEDIGDVFKMQVSYASTPCGAGIVPSAVTDVEVQQAIITGRVSQHDTYELEFAIQAAGLNVKDKLAIRIRNIVATGTAITGEIVVFDTILELKRDKLGGIWS